MRLVLLLAIVGGLVALLTAVRTWDYISEFSEWCMKNQVVSKLDHDAVTIDKKSQLFRYAAWQGEKGAQVSRF